MKLLKLYIRISSSKRLSVAFCFLLLYIFKSNGQEITRQSANLKLKQLNTSTAYSNRIKILLELGKFHVFKPGEAKLDLDSGFSYLQQAQHLSDSLNLIKWQHETQCMIMILNTERGDTLLAKSQFLQLLNDCRRTGDKEGEANAFYRLGIWLGTREENYQQVLQNFQKAAALYRQTDNQEKEINMLQQIALIHLNIGKLDTAKKELLNVLNRYRAIAYTKLHYTYNLISIIYRFQGDLDKSLQYALLCIRVMNASKDTVRAAAFFEDIARLYMELGDYDNSIENFRKALEQWRVESVANSGMYLAAGYVIQDLIKHNRSNEALNFILRLQKEISPVSLIQKACVAEDIAYCYDALKNNAQAEKYYLQSIVLFEQSGADFEASEDALANIGKFYLEQKKYNKASFYLNKVLATAPRKLATATVKDIHLMLFHTDSAQGHYLSAIQHLHQYKALNDSIFNVVKMRDISRLQIQYATKKKEEDIQLLTNQNKLEQIKLQQANQREKVIIAGAFLLLVISGLLLVLYYTKKRSNKQVLQKNELLQRLLSEKEWLLKEVHHRVKNNLHTVISLLESQSAYAESDARNAIKESQHRIQAMSLIHQRLYNNDNLTTINMAEYVPELVRYLKDSFALSTNIVINTSIHSVELDLAQAIPVGLLLNEAITNSIKHAFSSNRKGSIEVQLQKSGADVISLSIADNGIGLPQDFNYKNSNSLGMKLIKGLSEDIGADVVIESNNGLCISLQFEIEKLSSSELSNHSSMAYNQ